MPKNSMKATVWEGQPFHMAVKSWPVPRIRDPRDVIVRLTTAAICGSDLHDYHGLLGSRYPPWVMGHEGVGIVTEVGDAVVSVKRGDRVVVSACPSCGFCDNCVKSNFGYCLNVNPPNEGGLIGEGADFGDVHGHFGGTQSEYIRVPFADNSCVLIPPGKEKENDYVMISDIFCTAWWGVEASGFQSGDSVAVFGAGPVGLLAAYSAILRGARVVYSIDHVRDRLEKARSIGAVPIDFTEVDPVAEIMKHEPRGVTRSLDCVGLECVNRDLKPQIDYVISSCVAVTASRGGIALVGVYWPSTGPTPGAPRSDPATSAFPVPVGELWMKGLTVSAGVAEIRRYQPVLRDLIESGRATPSFVVSSEVDIEGVPEAYRRFSEHKETKVLIHFDWDEAEREREGRHEPRRFYHDVAHEGRALQVAVKPPRPNIH